MKTHWSLNLLLLGMLIVSGCHQTAKVLYGVRDPKTIPVSKVERYLTHKKIPAYDGWFILKDSVSFMEYINRGTLFSGVLFFNRQGELLKIKDTGYCSGIAYKVACSLNTDSAYALEPSLKLRDIASLVSPIRAGDQMTSADADFVMVGLWGTFMGKINSNVFKTFEEAAAIPGAKKKIYLLDLDLLEEWGMKNKLRISLK